MSTASRVTLTLVALCGIGAAYAFRARGDAPVVEMTDLEPYDVRTAGFALEAPAEIQVRAVGAERPRPGGVLGMLGVTAPRWLRDDERQDAWVGNAWILDASTRRVVWELRREERADEDDGLFEFEGGVKLPRGVYEVHYASVAVPHRRDDGQWSRRDRKLADDFAMVVTGAGRALSRAELERTRRDFARNAIATLTGVRDGETRQAGFALDRETEVDVYAVGEAREDETFDRGWIIDAKTRRVVWELGWEGSQPAGGASKNRMARATLRLPAGKYAAFFTTDDSHGPAGWNSPPPLDTEMWGLTVSLRDGAQREHVQPFTYEPVPSGAAFVRMVGVQDETTRWEGFRLHQPMHVRVYAIGEQGGDDMADFAWITDADGRPVWRMKSDRTQHAGGARKNRVADTVLALPAGSYVVRYRTDDSHASGDWNASAPTDPASWGVTLLPASGERADSGHVTRVEVLPTANLVARVTAPRGGETETVAFTLARDTDLDVRALGEGTDGEMHDYAWIEETRANRTVWTMAYDRTTHAGGAEKNRFSAVRLRLPAGEYRLRYKSDDSHGANDWNAAPPDAPEAWGVVVTRVK